MIRNAQRDLAKARDAEDGIEWDEREHEAVEAAWRELQRRVYAKLRKEYEEAMRHKRGFTMLELLTAIVIIIIVFGVTAYMLGTFERGAATSVGVNAVAIATKTARAYSVQATPGDFASGGFYSGTAAIFTPAREIRLAINVADATDELGRRLEERGLNGYADIDERSYVHLPKGVGVVGIVRNDGWQTGLITPPFAIRFDQTGRLAPSDWSVGGSIVVYDSDADGTFGTTDLRPTTYTPDDYDPLLVEAPVDSSGRYVLPFEALACPIGVVVYRIVDFRAEGLTLDSDPLSAGHVLNMAATSWILENGRHVLFSRYSGEPLKAQRGLP